MKNLYPFITLLFIGMFTSGCLNDLNKVPPSCFDGILNNGELETDCGGPCIQCDPCENGLWDYELGETWVDCGGDCGDCPPHANGCQDAGESGIDCGGTSLIACASLCNDGLPNGWENAAIDPDTSQPWVCDDNYSPQTSGWGIDCGQGCDPCETCDDGILNQNEIWIDCGGICTSCIPVSTGSCINGIPDGDELDIDCGAYPDSVGYCPQCELQLECYVDGVLYSFEYELAGEKIDWTDSFGTPRITIEFSGTASNGWELSGQIAELSPAGWNLASEMYCNASSFAAGDEGSFLTITSPDFPGGSISTQYIVAPATGLNYMGYTLVSILPEPGYVIGEFNGNCMAPPPSSSTFSITGGKFKIIHSL